MSLDIDRQHWPMWIGGEPIEAAASGETYTTYNPATGAALATVPAAGAEDVDRAVAVARTAFDGGKWARTSAARRTQLMNALAARMREEFKAIVTLEARDIGKAISSVGGEIHQGLSELEFFAGAATKIQGSTNDAPNGFLNYTVREPMGVCALIVPWNYPLLLLLRKMSPALAAGNAVVIKPAGPSPLGALAMAELAADVGFPPGAINVLTGEGSVAGAALTTHPGVDKVSFTGSTEVGRKMLDAAKTDFRRLSLELGGKSPALVFEDADLEAALPGCVWSIFYSAGQSCDARSRILVHRPIYDEFVERFAALTAKIRVGDPMDKETHVGALISARHRDSVEDYVRSGVEEGAEIAVGGTRPDFSGSALEGGSFLMPTALVGARNDMRVAQEEIFGPVATIIPFEDEREALRDANDVIYGLTSTIWTQDISRAHGLAARIKSGVVTVNQPFTVFPGTPFGGYKQSGWGREASLDAIQDFTELKSVLLYTGRRPLDPFGLGG